MPSRKFSFSLFLSSIKSDYFKGKDLLTSKRCIFIIYQCHLVWVAIIQKAVIRMAIVLVQKKKVFDVSYVKCDAPSENKYTNFFFPGKTPGFPGIFPGDSSRVITGTKLRYRDSPGSSLGYLSLLGIPREISGVAGVTVNFNSPKLKLPSHNKLVYYDSPVKIH